MSAKPLRLALAALLACVLFPLSSGATGAATWRDGDIDTTFGDGGVARTDFALASGAASNASLLLPDGKLLVAGATLNNITVTVDLPDDFALARFNADGLLDTTFGVGGRARADFPGRGAAANALARQSDGKIVLVGYAGRDLALARFNADGSLDSTFGGGGTVITDFGDEQQVLTAVGIQPSGQIVVAGYGYGGGCQIYYSTFYEHMLLGRYNADGSLDDNFGVFRWVESNGHAAASALSIAADGSILLAGDGIARTERCADDSDRGRVIELRRFTAGGEPDAAFGGDGATTTILDGSVAVSAVELSDNGPVVAGRIQRPDQASSDFLLARFDSAGALDPSFGISGTVRTDFAGGDDQATALAVLPDGKLLASGPVSDPNYKFGLARYNADGTLDAAFGQQGKAAADFNGHTAQANGLVVDPASGRIVVNGSSERQMALAAFHADGSNDPAFGHFGQALLSYSGNDSPDTAQAVAVQPDGKVVLAGQVISYTAHFTLARYNTNGTLDASFGVGGKVMIAFTGASTANALLVQPDGKIVAGGAIDGNFAVVRYNRDGTLDRGFGNGGIGTMRFATSGPESVAALALLPNGAILAAGSSGNNKLALARFTRRGAADYSFGNIGQASGGEGFQRANSLTVAPDGKIILAIDDEAFSVARFNANGTLDTSFGNSGKASDTRTTLFRYADYVALQPGGKIVVAGGTYFACSCDKVQPDKLARPDPSPFAFTYLLGRYNSDGSVDTTFGNDGRLGGPVSSSSRHGLSVMMTQADGRILAVVSAGNSRSLVRYKRDGEIDPSFGAGGSVQVPVGADDGAARLAQFEDSLLVSSGSDDQGSAGDFVVMRYHNRRSFSDIARGDYFYQPVLDLVERGAISGYADGSFRPYASATRAQLAKIVVSAAAWPLTNPPTPSFSDVPADNSFYQYIETAHAHGIVGGYGDGSFRPYNDITRGQLAKIISLAAAWSLPNPTTPSFSDVPSDSPFYQYVEAAHTHNAISGYGDGTFRPANNATRGQIAKIVAATVVK